MRLRLIVLASLLTALIAVLAPGMVSAAPRHNDRFTINALPHHILAGEGVLIYGQLAGNNVAGQTIRLYHRVNPSPYFTLVATTKTDAQGFYDFTRAEGVVMTNRSWFVRGPHGSHSRTIRERVSALVSLSDSTSTSDTRHAIVFTGHVTPDHPFERVYLQEHTGAGDDWSTIATGVTGGDSNYSIAHRWRTAGVHEVRVVFRGDDRNTRSVSDSVPVAIEQAQVAGFTIASSVAIIGDGGSVTVSGVLDQPGTTTPESGVSVTLYGRTAGSGGLIPLADDSTGTDGSYSFVQAPAHDTVYQVRTTIAPRRHTSQLFVGVRDSLTAAASANTSTVGGTVTFSGSVFPDHAGDVVYLQRLGSDGDWHTVKAGTITGASAYSLSWTFDSAGTKVFRVRVPGDPTNVGVASPGMSISVSEPASLLSLPPAS